MSLKGKVVVVTGAASGIGLSTAIHFLSQGARVVFADINLEKLKKAMRDHGLTQEEDILTVKCDVSREESVEELFQLALAKFGYVDSVVNNAGLMIFKPLEQHTHDDWTKILSVDLLGAFFFTRQAFLHMSRGGSIINVSSIHAVETTPMVSSYAAAKAALLSLTRSAAIEGKPKGIRVNAVLPGAIDTPMLWENPNIKSGLEVINESDVGKPENLAAVIAFLASDEAAFVQGASIRVDGGRLAKL